MKSISGILLEYRALFVPVGARETGMKGVWNGTRKRIHAGAERELASAG
jgi:hypothetical protein